MITEVLGGGPIDGQLGDNPDWGSISCPSGRTLQSTLPNGSTQFWYVSDTQEVGGQLLASENFANPRSVSGNSLDNSNVIQAMLVANGYSGAYGYFHQGFTVSNSLDLGVDNNYKFWKYVGAETLPYAVSQDTDPSAGDWELVKFNEHSALIGKDAPNSHHATAIQLNNGEDVESEIFKIKSSALQNQSDPILIDMHSAVLRGVGFNNAETGGAAFYDVVNTVNSGNVVEVTNASNYMAGQLLTYQAVDSNYYSAVVDSVSGNEITLKTNIEVQIPAGNKVYNFYNDEAHPNQYGFRAIADYAVRESKSSEKEIFNLLNIEDFLNFGNSTISTDSTVSYDNPSSLSISVTVNSVGGGVSTDPLILKPQTYRADLSLNPNGGTVTLGVREVINGVETTVLTKQFTGSSVISDSLCFKPTSGAFVKIYVTSSTVTHQFDISKLSVSSVTSSQPSIDNGKHVLLGDSWFVLTGIYDRLLQTLPNADIVNKGIGGNTAAQMVARFNTDVKPEKPSYVWIIAGTNDLGQGVSQIEYNRNINRLISLCAEIGAKPIVFTCSVGAINHSIYGNLLTESRNYALKTTYRNALNYYETLNKLKTVTGSIAVPASSKRLIFCSQDIVNSAATLKSYYAVGSSGQVTGNIRAGYGPSIILGVTEDLISVALQNLRKEDLQVTKSNSNNRFLIIELENTDTSDLVINYSMEIEYKPT